MVIDEKIENTQEYEENQMLKGEEDTVEFLAVFYPGFSSGSAKMISREGANA
jgi:hypothetical protein